MIAALLLLLGLAWAADTDSPVEGPGATDTAAPAPGATDTDVAMEATDTDVPEADTDSPADTDDPGVDLDAPPPATWPGWDTFVGPELPDDTDGLAGDEAEPGSGTTAGPGSGTIVEPGPETTAEPATTTEPDPSGVADPAEPATDAATEPESPGEPSTTAEPGPTTEPGSGTSQQATTRPDPGDPYRLPTYLPFLPTLPLRGWRIGILLALITGLAWGTARLLDPVRDWLAPTGVLPTVAGATQQVLRVVALFFALGVIAAVIPQNLEPALPWVVLAGAVALGWSAREVTPDFIAGIVLAAERKVRPGQWIGTPDIAGVVEQVTLRVTWVRDATGRRVAVPNRAFLREAVVTDRGQWPSMEVVVRVPGEPPPSTVRRVIEDAVLVSPWSAPLPPDLVREEQDAGLWRVRARVLEGRFADRFEGALREHVEEVLSTGTGLRAEVSRRSDDDAP